MLGGAPPHKDVELTLGLFLQPVEDLRVCLVVSYRSMLVVERLNSALLELRTGFEGPWEKTASSCSVETNLFSVFFCGD